MSRTAPAPTTTTGPARTDLDPVPVSVRVKLSALWAAMLFVYVYVDLFSLYRSDIRADLDAGTVWAFTVGQGFLLGVTLYVAVPSLLVFLTLVLPAQVARWTNLVLASVYLLTVLGGVVGETWVYYLVGSALEVAALVAVIGYAWTWPRVGTAHAGHGV